VGELLPGEHLIVADAIKVRPCEPFMVMVAPA
jgi:hypothetical protein